ncbi:penicillin-binding protein 1A [Deferribacter desulfuricans SSM1]|uniref:Penicillin-binding protein 1A n=1 Tax=Deferribacter desulfuricans (strain DSM 14783 / JCM 11476 / NBRC 101012 / SSM1) TaxID=639282 RepID=D3PC19_DEFDS|nr:PBP1A family penicillin-binding protein [Deferribacter desulfuricans]BAI80142.1 penicillin-binding protein 1A [Deferribacter desulfuricans SSM1]
MKFLKIFLIIFLIFTILITGGLTAYFLKLSSELPSVKELKNFQYKTPTLILDEKERIIAEIGTERRYPVPLSKIPDYLKKAVIAVEDSRFYEHGGVDLLGIIRAFIKNIKAGRIVEGGSTLTQQLVKILYLTPERKLKRKVKEAILAYKLDNYLSKDKILEMYLNQVYFGRGAYGVEAAARVYFGKHVDELTVDEAALIAGLPKAPGLYAPHLHPDKALKRRNHVLYRMFEEGYLSEQQYKEYASLPINIVKDSPKMIKHAEYFVDFVKKYIKDKYDIDIVDKGYKIFTTLDLDFQIAAEKSVAENLFNLSKRQGYFGPLGNINDTDLKKIINRYNYIQDFGMQIAVVKNVERNKLIATLDNKDITLNLKYNKWAKPFGARIRYLDDFRKILKKGDIILVILKNNRYYLSQIPKAESALLSISPKDGSIYAMVGGFSYNKSMFNRAVQSKRQVGSLFKPIVYSAAIENGYNINTLIYDAPIILSNGKDLGYWKPENFEEEFYGFTTLKEALTHSRNVVTIKLAERLGVKTIKSYAKKFGITTELENDLSISIGSGSISLIEMVYAYSAFANLGKRVSPYFIKKINDNSDNVTYEETPPELIDTIKPSTAHIMSDLLINVVENGTGRKAKSIPRIIGGKTGTTNEYRDAWFIGVMPNIITGVWTGFDDFKPLGRLETGSRAALPAFVSYTKKIIDFIPFEEFPVSNDITYYKVDKNTHKITDSYSTEYTFEPFYDKNSKESIEIK